MIAFDAFDIEAFLRDTWQKKPCLIRSPWVRWRNPLDPDELAGLACENGIESRLIVQGRKRLKVAHGPFAAKHFAKLGKRPWTLLVQAVDHHVPDVAALLAPFRFIPNWRIDDVMVSYAVDGGGVGAHFDQYDVFLVQGLGQRRWQIGAACDAGTALLPHDALRLLAHFEPVDEWVLGPGDMLYLPPGIAHNGIAVGDDCMTYSIGFRAPARAELIAHWCDHVLADLVEDDRYTDAGSQLQANAGEIGAEALAKLQAMVLAPLADAGAFARWFGRHVTTPKYDGDDVAEGDRSIALPEGVLGKPTVLRRNPASRFSFVSTGESRITLFVDGTDYQCVGAAVAFGQSLCTTDTMVFDCRHAGSEVVVALATALIEAGALSIEPSD